jgi:site-specific DNA-methyltransferase (adenine-specific)
MWCEAWSVECLRVLKPGGYMLAFGGTRTSHRLACAIEDAGFEIRDSIAWLYGSGFPKHRAALKPAFEPIVMGRKPFGTSLIVNEAKYGTGALNIDGCRVESSEAWAGNDEPTTAANGYGPEDADGWQGNWTKRSESHAAGRWPANVVLDGSQADALDAQAGIRTSGAFSGFRNGDKFRDVYSEFRGTKPESDGHEGSTGGASRFFPVMGRDGEASADKRYTDTGGTDFAATPGARREPVAKSELFPTFRYEAKAPTSERPTYQRDGEVTSWGGIRTRCTICGRQEVNVSGACDCPEPDFKPDPAMAGKVAHPTVKPLDLMRWLVRLVTPPGGTVLEPFAGSGTTAEACILEGFKCIAIEREADYLPLIIQRISKPLQVGFDFGEVS